MYFIASGEQCYPKTNSKYHPKKIISELSIIAAIINKGIITKIKTLRQFIRYSLNASFLFFLKMNVPNFIPSPNEINTAGSWL